MGFISIEQGLKERTKIKSNYYKCSGNVITIVNKVNYTQYTIMYKNWLNMKRVNRMLTNLKLSVCEMRLLKFYNNLHALCRLNCRNSYHTPM